MRERYGVEVLAVYVYPAQVTFCAKAFSGLADLAGRRVRIGNPSQSDLVRALGGSPAQTEFAEIVTAISGGTVECAMTGAMSGNTIGLDKVTTHINPRAITWGLSVFGANLAAWNALPAWLKTELRRELPKLELAIWAESERETNEGVACNTGATTCVSGRKGKLVEVSDSAADDKRLREIFSSTILARWVERCGPHCVSVWNQYLAPVVGIEAKSR